MVIWYTLFLLRVMVKVFHYIIIEWILSLNDIRGLCKDWPNRMPDCIRVIYNAINGKNIRNSSFLIQEVYGFDTV